MAEAVNGLRARGYSWAEIGAWLGISARLPSNAGAHLDMRVNATW